jgi:putative MATE family efflux protein
MKRDYSRIQVYRRILVLAWPAIVEQLLVMTVGIVSTAFVGRIGTNELAAVGLVGMIVVFLQTVFAGLATGATVVIARLTGEGDIPGAKRALVQSLLIGAVSGVLVTAPALVFARPILGLFFAGADPEVLRIGLSYFLVVMVGTPFLVLDLVVAGAVRGSGDTRTPMFVTLGVNALNVALNAFLVPRYGIAGSAVSVMASRIAGGLVRVVVVFVKPGAMRLGRGDAFSADLALIVRIVRVGLPAFLEQLVMQGGFLMMQVIIIGIGVVPAASFQVGVNVNSFAFMPVFGLSIAVTTIVGQSLGRRDLHAAGVYAFEANILGVAVISVIGAANLLFAGPLASMFTRDPKVIALSASMIAVFSCISPFLGVMSVSAGVLRAAGDIIYVMVTALVGLWLFRVVVSLVLIRFSGLGIYGVMAGIAVDFVVRAAMYGLRVRAGRWKGMRV